MIVHSGMSARDLNYMVGLHSMTGSSTDALLLDPGTLLEHDGETIQLVNAPQQVRGQQWSVRLIRGWGGTTIRRHAPAFWRITGSPAYLDERTPEERKRDRHAYVGTNYRKCPNCGAPDQECEEKCRYCAVMVPVK